MPKFQFIRGDILSIEYFARSFGETADTCNVLVLSNDVFNQSEMALVAPIINNNSLTERGFSVSLMGTGLDTSGVVLANAGKILDLRARQARFKEKCPYYIVDEVLEKFKTIL